MGDSYPVSDLVLRERSGRRRELRLSREALPFRPVSFPRRLRGTIETYQGNPDATHQVFGPEFSPIALAGFWKDRWLGSAIATVTEGDGDTATGERLTTAKALLRVVEDIWLSASELDFAWDDERWRVRIWDFEPRYHRGSDIEWSMRLEVVGPGSDPVEVEYTPEVSSDGGAQSLLAVASSWLSTAQLAMRKMQAKASELERHIDRVDVLRRQLSSTIDQAGQTATTPVRLSTRVAQSAEGMIDVWRACRRTTATFDAATEAHSNAWDRVFETQSARTELDGACSDAISGARTIRGRALRVVSPSVVRIVTVRERTTLRAIAANVYGDPSGWEQIAEFNGIESQVPAVGTVLLIPERSASRTSAPDPVDLS